MKNFTLLFSFILLCSVPAHATRYLVETGASGDGIWANTTSGTVVNLTTENKSLNAWISATVKASDEVWLCHGTYPLAATVYLNLSNVSLNGGFEGTESSLADREMSDLDENGQVDPWEFTFASVLDGGGAVRCINVQGDVSTMVNGVTVQNGLTNNGGAGIYLSNNGFVTHSVIRNNLVKNNTGNTAACGIQNIGGTIDGCLIEGNVTDAGAFNGYGGGVVCNSVLAFIKNSVVRNNEIKSTSANVGNNKGGGIYLQNAGQAYNCVVYNNTNVGNGGGIYLDKTTLAPYCTVYYCTVVNNKAGNQSGGIHTNASGIVINTVIWNNVSGQPANNNAFFYKATTDLPVSTNINYIADNGGISYSTGVVPALIKVDLTGESDIFENPTTIQGAVSGTDIEVINKANWQLTPESPLLNKGSILTEVVSGLLGVLRPQGIAPDLGAYELPYFTLSTQVGSNGKVTTEGNTSLLSSYLLPRGSQMTVNIAPDQGYAVSKIMFGGVDITSSYTGNPLTLPVLDKDASFSVDFDLSTGIDNVSADGAFNSYLYDGSIFIQNALPKIPVYVYNLDGKVVLSLPPVSGSYPVSLPAGYYVVSQGDQSSKIVVFP